MKSVEVTKHQRLIQVDFDVARSTEARIVRQAELFADPDVESEGHGRSPCEFVVKDASEELSTQMFADGGATLRGKIASDLPES